MQRNLRAKHHHDAGGGQAEGFSGDQEEGGVVVGEEPPAATLTAPVDLTAQPTGNVGDLSARWSAVPNRKFYEVQIIPVGEAAVSTVWDELPTRPVSTGKSTSKASPPAALSASASAPSEPKVPGPGATPSPPASDPDRQDPARTSY